jgi:hypothetical protein
LTDDADDNIPVLCRYKNVAIFADQPPKRVALVKREIDRVHKIDNLERLCEIAGDVRWSPESRLLAGAKCVSGLRLATERREQKPNIAVESVEARTAGLGSIGWRNPWHYCSLLDAHCDENAVPRERPLTVE